MICDGVCGKTSLVAEITEGKFINNYHMTLGGGNSLLLAAVSDQGTWGVLIVI